MGKINGYYGNQEAFKRKSEFYKGLGTNRVVRCENQGCNNTMTVKVKSYSKSKFGKAICWSCQQKGNI